MRGGGEDLTIFMNIRELKTDKYKVSENSNLSRCPISNVTFFYWKIQISL
jgi:hypothetical protein